jgi:hypothetical protein
MRLPWSGAIIAGLGLLVAACASTDGAYSGIPQPSCGDEPEKRLSFVDWRDSREIDIRIRLGDFWPMVLELHRDQPYLLRITNVDAESRIFSSPDLFKVVYLRSVSIDGRAPEYNPADGLRLPPNSSAEVQLVALCGGRFEFRESWFPTKASDTAQGVIYVQ